MASGNKNYKGRVNLSESKDPVNDHKRGKTTRSAWGEDDASKSSESKNETGDSKPKKGRGGKATKGTQQEGRVFPSDDGIAVITPIDSSGSDPSAAACGEGEHAATLPAPKASQVQPAEGAIAVNDAKQRPSTCTRAQVLKCVYYAHLLLITLAMAVLDFDDPLVLGLGAVLADAFVVWKTFEYGGAIVAVPVQCVVATSLGVMAYMVYRVNQTEKYCKKYAAIGVELEARGPDALGPPSTPALDDQAAPPPRQPAGGDVKANRLRAEELGPAFEENVLGPVRAAGEAVAGRCCTHTGFNIKGAPRAFEKAKKDYKGDGARLVDLLRGAVVCEEMDDVLGCFSAIFELERAGVVRVCRIKNRLRDGGVPGSGYRDVNLNLEFEGHICELQVQLRAFYEVKKAAHSAYNVVRSLGVEGDLGEVPDSTRLDWGHRIAVTFLLLVAGCSALLMGWYVTQRNDGPYYSSLMLGPWALLLYFCFARLLRALRARSRVLAGVGTFIFAVLPSYVAIYFFVKCNDDISSWEKWGISSHSYCGVAPVALLFVVLTLRDLAKICRKGSGAVVRRRSRIGLMYDRFLGLNGSHFAYRVLTQQLFMIALQSWGKLLGFSSMLSCAAKQASMGLRMRNENIIEFILFWAIVAALVTNILYPVLLLRSKRVFVQRDMPSFFDAFLDLVYGPFVFLLGYLNFDTPVGDLGNLETFLSYFAPSFHIFTVACSIELAALQRAHARQVMVADGVDNGRRSSFSRRLGRLDSVPWRILAGFTVVAISLLGTAIGVGCHGRYPNVDRIKFWGGDCLDVTMDVFAKSKTLDLYRSNIGDEGASALATALATNDNLETLHLDGNYIGDENLNGNNIGDEGASALATALTTNDNLKTLSLSANNIGNEGASALATALATNDNLETLYLNGNNIGDAGASALATALATNDNLETLYLKSNNIGDEGKSKLREAAKNRSSLRVALYDWD